MNKTIIILLIISVIIALSVSYFISTQEITSENVQPNYSKETDNKDWEIFNKKLELEREEFCRKNPIKCDKG